MRWLLEPNASLTTGSVGALVSSSGSSNGSIFCTGIAFAAVNHKSLYVPYVDDLLNRLKKGFLAHCSSIDDCDSFDKIFDKILMAVEMEGKKERCGLPPSNCLYNSPQEKEKLQRNRGIEKNLQVENGSHSRLEEDLSNIGVPSTSDGEVLANRSKIGMRVIAGRTKAGRRAVGNSNRASTPEPTTTKKKGTVWHDGSSRRKITKKDMESLDKSKARGGGGV